MVCYGVGSLTGLPVGMNGVGEWGGTGGYIPDWFFARTAGIVVHGIMMAR